MILFDLQEYTKNMIRFRSICTICNAIYGNFEFYMCCPGAVQLTSAYMNFRYPKGELKGALVA